MSDAKTVRFEDGAAYERFMSPWSQSAGKIFLAWLGARQGLRWIDVGCGNGAFTELIEATCAPSDVQAIDPSGGQLAFARQRATVKKAQFRQGDAMTLPYADASADVATMALVLFFVPEPKKAVAEMARVVGPNGLVASYTWDVTRGGFPSRAVLEELDAMGKSPLRPPSAEASKIENLRMLWREAGLVDIEAREILVSRTFETFADYWECGVVTSPSNPVTRLSADEVSELRRRLQNRLPMDAAGRIELHACATAIKGRRPG